MTKVAIYGVYDGDKLIFKGGRREVAEYFSIKQCSIATYVSGRAKIQGKYDVKNIGWEYRKITYKCKDETRRIEKYHKTESKNYDYQTDPLEFLLLHLKMYGNTIVSSDPTIYVNDLIKEGFKVKITPRVDYTAVKRLTGRGRKPKQKVHYLVEVVNAG